MAEKLKLSAILKADVQGYSRLMGEDESFTVCTLIEYQKVFASHIEERGGRVVNAPGDSILAELPSVVDAVQSAIEIQEQLKRANAELSDDRKMNFRIGINLDDNEQNLLTFINNKNITFQQIMDDDRSISDKYDVKFIPMIFFINPEGVIIGAGLRGARLQKTVSKYID